MEVSSFMGLLLFFIYKKAPFLLRALDVYFSCTMWAFSFFTYSSAVFYIAGGSLFISRKCYPNREVNRESTLC